MKLTLFLTTIMAAGALAQCGATEMTSIFQDNQHQFTGVAISRTGRLFVNYPRWQDPHQMDVGEVRSDGSVLPYPNAEWNNWQAGSGGSNHWVCVQAVYVDDLDTLWVVDPGAPKMKKVADAAAKLVAINLHKNHVERVYNLTDLVGPDSYLNDVRVDTQNHTAYLTESKNGGIVVVDTDSGAARLVLNKSYSVKSDPNHILMVDGVKLTRDGEPFKGNSDGIALSPDRQWLYYKPLSDTKLYRVPTHDLRDTNLTPAQLEKKVADLGANFTASDGMIFDRKGYLYMTDIEHNAIARVTPDLKMEIVLHDPRLIWPDSFAWGPDGLLYVSCSQIQTMAWCNGGKITRTTPYTLYQLKVNERNPQLSGK